MNMDKTKSFLSSLLIRVHPCSSVAITSATLRPARDAGCTLISISCPSADQKPHQAVDRKIGEPSAFQRAHFWLIDPKQFGRLNLREPPLLDDLVDMADELGFCHQQDHRA